MSDANHSKNVYGFCATYSLKSELSLLFSYVAYIFWSLLIFTFWINLLGSCMYMYERLNIYFKNNLVL